MKQKFGLIPFLVLLCLLLSMFAGYFIPEHFLSIQYDHYLKPFQKENLPLGSDQLGRNVFWRFMHSMSKSVFLSVASTVLTLLMAFSTVIFKPLSVPKKNRWYYRLIPFFLIYFAISFLLIDIHIIFKFTSLIILFISIQIFWGKFLVPFYSGIHNTFKTLTYSWFLMPDLLVLILFSELLPNKDMLGLIFLLSITKWPGLAFYVQMELENVTKVPHINYLIRHNVHYFRIWIKELIPRLVHIFTPRVVLLMGKIMVLESSINFLGLGFQYDPFTLGTMISEMRLNLSAWWVYWPPIIFIVSWVLFCQILLDHFRKR